MIPLNLHVLGTAEMHAVAHVIRSGWLAEGPQVAAFEKEFAARVGADHACAVSSGAAAFHLALVAVGVVAGDEVILPANAHTVCVSAVLRCGAKPIFVALEGGSDNMAAAAAAAAVTKRTRALLCCHNYGMPCDLSRIRAVAASEKIAVVEDAVAAIGSQIFIDDQWTSIGEPHGLVACFAFHPGSIITAGGGGVITTSRHDFDHTFRAWREQDPIELVDSGSERAPRRGEGAVACGYDYRLSDVQAAIGREQLKRLDGIVAARRALAARYRIFLNDAEVDCPEEPGWSRSNWQSYCVTLPIDVSVDAVVRIMADNGVATRRGAMSVEVAGDASQADPPSSPLNGRRAASEPQDRRLLLPLYPSMSERVQRRVAGALILALTSARSFEP